MKDRLFEIETDVLAKNDATAQRNRSFFQAKKIPAINLLSSPGSGKTSLLENTIRTLGNSYPFFVIEGDQQTENDARRIKASGATAVQVNTGEGCHLEADMVAQALTMLQPQSPGFVLIENVGNLVCPAMFDLGETARVVVISVTEGEDKPLKYPAAFESADACVISKVDLLPYLEVDMALLEENIRRVNPHIAVVRTSYHQENREWFSWLESQLPE